MGTPKKLKQQLYDKLLREKHLTPEQCGRITKAAEDIARMIAKQTEQMTAEAVEALVAIVKEWERENRHGRE